MTSVFISYSRRDKAIAEVIAVELRNRGAEVFIDYQELVAGESFIGRLGREIEKRDCVVFLVSPRSVESKWVQAEIAWGFTKGKTVIPVLLEPATMVDFFFLINVEQVDFTRWSIDGNIQAALHKLALSLKLPTEPTRTEPVPEITSTSAPTEEPRRELEPIFATGDLSDMFITAADIAADDPEQALFLYHQVLQLDPNYLKGRAKAIIERDEARLKPARLQRMLSSANAAVKVGEWERANRIAKDVLTLDVSNTDAERIINLCEKNLECEPVYQQAIASISKGRWNAAIRFLQDVRETCPNYGDPSNLYKLADIQKIFVILPTNIQGLKQLSVMIEHTGSINFVAFSSDSKLLASASSDNTVRLWSVATRQPLATFTEHLDIVNSVAFSSDSKLLASASNDNTVRLWNIAEHQQLVVFTGHTHYVNSVAFAPDGKLLASAANDHTIRLWDVVTGQQVAMLTGHSDSVKSVAFAPDGKLLASAANDHTIRLWDAITHQQLDEIPHRYSDPIPATAFTPDGKLLAFTSGVNEDKVTLWDIDRRIETGSIGNDYGSVSSFAFSPDGQLAVLVYAIKYVFLWEVSINKELPALSGHTNTLRSVAFSPDGTLLASGSDDKTIILWGLP